MADCLLCGRNVEIDLTVAVDFEGIGITTVCHECWERGEEAARVDEEGEDAA